MKTYITILLFYNSLSLTFDGLSNWFFLGYIFYLILIIAIAVTAVFYLHLENHIGKKNYRIKISSCRDPSTWYEYWWSRDHNSYDLCRISWFWYIRYGFKWNQVRTIFSDKIYYIYLI